MTSPPPRPKLTPDHGKEQLLCHGSLKPRHKLSSTPVLPSRPGCCERKLLMGSTEQGHISRAGLEISAGIQVTLTLTTPGLLQGLH